MPKKLTQEEFIKRAKEFHGEDTYDYSLVKYVNMNTPVEVVCKRHGSWSMRPAVHLRGSGCAKCDRETKKESTESYINRVRAVFGDKYDYRAIDFVNFRTKVKVICPIHGEWTTYPDSLLAGSGCCKCGHEKRAKQITKIDEETFIREATKVHGGRYSYEHINYKNTKHKVTVTCPVHGDFQQLGSLHLSGQGCMKCAVEARADSLRDTTEDFIRKAKAIHGEDKYDYSRVKYVNVYTKVIIGCKLHGFFTQRAGSHLKGDNCPECGILIFKQKMTYTNEEYITMAKKTHKDLYDYSQTKYIRMDKPVDVICRVHGLFQQKAWDHVRGCHCPKCRHSSGEDKIREYLEQSKFYYSIQYKNPNCKVKNLLRFDFAVFFDTDCTNVKALIEFDGAQHFHPVEYFGGEVAFKKLQYYDEIKNKYCLTNNIKLIRIPYYEMNSIDSILDKELQLEG